MSIEPLSDRGRTGEWRTGLKLILSDESRPIVGWRTIDELENKNQTIEELEFKLEQKNERIEELESASGSGEGGVSIEVTITRAGGNENFVEGGKAIVRADSENADVDRMRVHYGTGSYQLDSSGEVAIPLADPGTQEMMLVYGDTTKKVSITVQDQEGGSNATDGTVPGFTSLGGVTALLVFSVLVSRYREA